MLTGMTTQVRMQGHVMRQQIVNEELGGSTNTGQGVLKMTPTLGWWIEGRMLVEMRHDGQWYTLLITDTEDGVDSVMMTR